ncbi:phosphotransferase family protein [Planococcus halocryophilus]|uniref:phosphotransferase family protein n=1 Tax=Planococcus halocryophilus TaxID=1215089 RepID=UPI001F0EE4C5|nr:phosphotransferase family protein [Planococcus halocryophilus]MCH4827561.1 phosphotransferase family protein [Planococcus halocryophilus]
MTDTIEVRSGEEVNPDVLRKFIDDHLHDIPKEKLVIRQFGSGHSNLTYLLQIGDWEGVLRRPPMGPVAPKAHDMKREYTILNSLNRVFKPAPKPYVFSEDDQIVGCPFFIMERRNGIVLDSEFPSDIKYNTELGRKISQLMVDQLVTLHEINFEKTELINLVKPEGFMERQVSGWIDRYEKAKTSEIKGIDELKEYLINLLPSSPQPTIIHYDYKLNNAMFSENFSEMTGLFDWEMTTVGDPLSDLGVAMSYWIQGDDPDFLKTGLGEPPVTVMDGFYTRKEFIQSYAEKSGRDVSSINYYITFAYFKLAAICQQIYYRYEKGQTNDARFAKFNIFVENLIQHAVEVSKKKDRV